MPETIIVGAEFNSTCLWNAEGKPIEYDALRLPDDLRHRIVTWNRGLYGGPGQEDHWGEPDYEAEGLAIASELQKFLGDRYAVEYSATRHTVPGGEVRYKLAPDGSVASKA
jgi:hypothetical protein